MCDYENDEPRNESSFLLHLFRSTSFCRFRLLFSILKNNVIHDSALYVHLQIYNVKAGFGGGSVIDGNWILTAAHVFEKFSEVAMKRKNWKKYFLVVVGTLSAH